MFDPASIPDPRPSDRPAWPALAAHHWQVRHLHLPHIFADDPQRGERLIGKAAAIYLEMESNGKHVTLEGDRRAPDPEALGTLVARAPCFGARVSWRIVSFEHWGDELGCASFRSLRTPGSRRTDTTVPTTH
ncbi:hypothetical protein [Cupriavidus sp. D39]|uniref:hypothetical protein n=1 Tax=Cupriavidus sp. D39 TaxID=2997877 RepID=UPI002270C92F|nr:hypothetical protein [Cupriavidus sp. D39]MCY0853976.1 hypothetical protein [Cupriavidus sp. D39]